FLSNIFENPFKLDGNLYSVHKTILPLIKDKKTISLISPWIFSFADINLDDTYDALYLPPFRDNTNKTEDFLKSLDIIIVDDAWTLNTFQNATQTYLRYKIHIEPFLNKNKNNYLIKNIDGFGYLYIKK
ncbi:hypothetical protein N8X83_01235, partial [Alphaproteobacteria bacterium]|nr:hypothetical protein [Alphaproteobacteria bacterium]